MAGIAAGLVVVAGAAIALLATRSGGDEDALPTPTGPAPTEAPDPTTTAATTAPAATAAPAAATLAPAAPTEPPTATPTAAPTAPPTTPAPPPTEPPTTPPPPTEPPTTPPPTEPPTTPAPPPPDPAATPTVPAQTPSSGVGSPQLMSNPLPGGLTWDQVAAPFALAQQLGDALANDDWNTARAIDTAHAGTSDQQYYEGYKNLDRVSLLLLDARPEGNGLRLLVVSVANEKQGAQTTLYCLEWTADVTAGTVSQHTGVVGQIARLPYPVSPEGVRNDPALDGTARQQCHWS